MDANSVEVTRSSWKMQVKSFVSKHWNTHLWVEFVDNTAENRKLSSRIIFVGFILD